MKKPLFVGNWKMNFTVQQTIDCLKKIEQDREDIVVCPPHTSLHLAKDFNIKMGAQNMHFEEGGAYTGEISATMLTQFGLTHVILGHSERRKYFFETNEIVNKKALKAIEHNMTPIICVGEDISENNPEDFVKTQVIEALKGADLSKVVIAYEPIWAIGTGKVATPEIANKMCGVVRDTIKTLHGEEVANAAHILYGGSVTSKNSHELLAEEHIDGFLIGGASLTDDFMKIAINQD